LRKNNFFGKGKYKVDKDGMLVHNNHFRSIYDIDFLARTLINSQKLGESRLYQGDFAKDPFHQEDLISPFHYNQTVRRSNGYSRNTYGQMFRAGR
jgi:hypothetical protein